MSTIKEATIESIKRLPDECTSEDIMYEVYLISQVLEGLEDAEAGRVMTTQDLLERISSWGK